MAPKRGKTVKNMDNTPINTNESMGFPPILIQNNKRFLRPCEVERLVAKIPKVENGDKFEALLFSGCRYIELQRLYKNPEWFDGEVINLSQKAIKKKKIVIKGRTVHLNPIGRRVIRTFLRLKTNLPSYKTWHENLIRWGELAGLDVHGLSPKTTRKTWESWLVISYPQYTHYIFLSQGHTQLTALNHYLNLNYSKQDKIDMNKFIGGFEW